MLRQLESAVQQVRLWLGRIPVLLLRDGLLVGMERVLLVVRRGDTDALANSCPHWARRMSCFRIAEPQLQHAVLPIELRFLLGRLVVVLSLLRRRQSVPRSSHLAVPLLRRLGVSQSRVAELQ
jgi:hypothetical protein